MTDNMHLLFSIVIPVYNVAPYLRECLDSVLAQTFEDWEALCVDDGSTDGSGAILDEYAAKDKRFTVIHQENKGVGAARNRGLDAASGEWIVFLDGDDILAIYALRRLSDAAAVYRNANLIRFGYAEFKDGETFGWPTNHGARPVELDITHTILMRDFYVYMWEVAYRNTMTQGLRFPQYRRGEDRLFVNAIQLSKANRMICIDDVLYGYRIRQASAVHSIPSLQVLCDEMDHRLDIMEMIDASDKEVDYAGNCWLEGYFSKKLPEIMLDRPDARAIKSEWRKRLPRLLQCKGLSKKGRSCLVFCSNKHLRPIGDFIIFTLPYLRYKATWVKPVTRLYRRLMRHGEFAR